MWVSVLHDTSLPLYEHDHMRQRLSPVHMVALLFVNARATVRSMPLYLRDGELYTKNGNASGQPGLTPGDNVLLLKGQFET